MSRRARRSMALLLSAATLVGCRPSGDLNATRGDVWAISSEPIRTIGAEGSDGGVALGLVQHAAFLSTGAIVVAEGGLGSTRLSVFPPAGGAPRLIGGPGDGPGEFRFITHVQVDQRDSLFVFDQQHQRVSVFGPDLALARTAQFAPGTGGTGGHGLRSVSRLSNGVWVGQGASMPHYGEPGRLLRDTIPFGVVPPDLNDFTAFGHLPGLMSTTIELSGRQALTTPMFSAYPIVATWGSCLFATSGEQPLVTVYASNGDVVGSIRPQGASRPVSDGAVEAFISHSLSEVPADQRPTMRQAFGRVARTTQLPFYGQMVIDDFGDMWLEEYQPAGTSATRWFVTSQRGDPVATVTVPRTMRIFEIGRAGILAVIKGEFGEDVVSVFPIPTKSERSDALEVCSPVP